jgi:hypothetical protein
MVTGTSLRTSREALRLTRIYPGTLYSTAGRMTWNSWGTQWKVNTLSVVFNFEAVWTDITDGI